MSFDVLIVGAGLSGAIIAHELALNNKKILVIEKRDHVAGNVFDHKIENINVHKYGPHIFHTNNDEVYNYMNKFWKLNSFKNQVEAEVKGKLIPIPFNFTGIDVFFPTNKEEIKKKLIDAYGEGARVSIFDFMKSDDVQIQEVAAFIYKNMFENYTTKMWGISPKNLGDDVMKRVPVAISYSTKYFRNKYEGIPQQGYANAIKNMLNHENIELKTSLNALSVLKFKDNKTYYEGKLFKGIVVYSGPVDELLDFKYGTLPYRSLFIDFKIKNKMSYQKTAVVNYPAEPKITRITEYKKMSNDISNKTVISIETPGAYDVKSKLFHTAYYPVTTPEGEAQYNKYSLDLKKYDNLFMIGRLATFKYINMDVAIELALNLSKKLVKRTKND